MREGRIRVNAERVTERQELEEQKIMEKIDR